MIIVEQINEKLIKHYSDKNVYIIQVETGIEYESAIDVIPCMYTYEETDKELPPLPEEETNDEEETTSLEV